MFAIKNCCYGIILAIYIQIPYASHAEQVHGKFALCFSSSLNSSRDYILLTLMVGCSTKHFLCNLMSLFLISECLRLELRGKYPFSVKMGYFLPYMFSTRNLG